MTADNFPIQYHSIRYKGINKIEVYDELEFNEFFNKRLYGGNFNVLTAKMYPQPTRMQPHYKTRTVIDNISGNRSMPYKSAIVVHVELDMIKYAVSSRPFSELKEYVKHINQNSSQEKSKKLAAIASHNLRYVHLITNRRTTCHRCKKNISTESNYICSICKWIKCDCGGCGCNY